jgi:hypothetical protein
MALNKVAWFVFLSKSLLTKPKSGAIMYASTYLHTKELYARKPSPY